LTAARFRRQIALAAQEATMDGGTGRCLCGAVRYRFEGAPNWQAHCHCESCRRATSSPITSFFAVDHGRVQWSGVEPKLHESSPGIFRSFCPRCGSPLTYQSDVRSHEIDIYALTLDRPEDFAAEMHVMWNERLPWLRIADDLPKRWALRRMAPEEDFGPVLALIRAAFAFMEGRIDPPSSMLRLTKAALAGQAREAEIWVTEEAGGPVACMVLTARADDLYLGKVAVAATHRHQGIARQLTEHAMKRARALGKAAVTLQTRVELTENHVAFEAMGFRKVGETAHEGFARPTSYTYRRDLA
jgi:N-acetylglutamate synthase-like GNAT family acetyltransferase